MSVRTTVMPGCLLAVSCFTVGCASYVEKAGVNYPPLKDPVCHEVALEVLDLFDPPVKHTVLSPGASAHFECIRWVEDDYRVTALVTWASYDYIATLHLDKQGQIAKVDVNPAGLQPLVGAMLLRSRVDSISGALQVALIQQGTAEINIHVINE